MNYNNYISYIICSNKNNLESIGYHNGDVNSILYLDNSNRKDGYKLILDNSLDSMVAIDADLINDDKLLQLLLSSGIKCIRIIDSGYVLTDKDYSKLKDFDEIIVDDVFKSLETEEKITCQKQIYIKEYQNNNDVTFFVNKELSKLDLAYLVYEINNCNKENKVLSYRMYNIDNYEEFLSQLNFLGLDSNVKIQFLSNPLIDNYKKIEKLDNTISNPIEIIFNSNSNFLNQYCVKPYTRYNDFHCELECYSATNLDSYKNLLNELELQSMYIKGKKYSPLEVLIYGYYYLHKHYYSEFNSLSFSLDFSKYSNTEFGLRIPLNNDSVTILYSLLMRLSGVEVYRYSVDNHIRNIVKLEDTKYNVNKIGIIDPTLDGININKFNDLINENSYTYFMLSYKDMLNLEDEECLNVATTLALSSEVLDYDKKDYCEKENIINCNYSPVNNAFALIHLWGYPLKDWNQFYSFLDKLNASKVSEPIDKDVIKNAFRTIGKSETPYIKSFDLAKKIRQVNTSLDKRKYIFKGDSQKMKTIK